VIATAKGAEILRARQAEFAGNEILHSAQLSMIYFSASGKDVWQLCRPSLEEPSIREFEIKSRNMSSRHNHRRGESTIDYKTAGLDFPSIMARCLLVASTQHIGTKPALSAITRQILPFSNAKNQTGARSVSNFSLSAPQTHLEEAQR